MTTPSQIRPEGLRDDAAPTAGRTGRIPLSPTTAVWMAIAVVVPIYRSLPGAVTQLWAMAVLAVIVASVALGRVARPQFVGVWLIAGYAALVATVTATRGSDVTGNLYVGIQLFIVLGLGIFVMVANVRRDPEFVRRVCIAFIASQSVSALVAAIQLAGSSVFGFGVVNGRAPGLAGHPNVLGIMSSLALILCLGAAVQKVGNRVVLVLISIVNAVGLLATGSLSSLSACAIGLIVVAISSRVKIATIVKSFVGASVLFWIAITYTEFGKHLETPADRYLQVTGQTKAVSTLEIRNDTYGFAWDAIRAHPLSGVGLNAANAASFDNVTVVHNVFLRSWYQGGVVLALAVALIICASALVAFRSMKSGKNAAAAGVLVSMMTFALTSAFFEQAYYWLPVVLAFACLSTDSDRTARSKAQPAQQSPIGN